MSHCVGDPRKHGIILLNHVSIWYAAKVITTSCLAAAILISMAANNLSSIALDAIELAVSKNVVVAFGILILSQIRLDIWALPFCGRHLEFLAERFVRQCRR